MNEVSALKPADYIKNSVGSLMYTYYTFIKVLHVRPIDLDDLVDGLLFIMSYNYVQKIDMQKAEAAREQKSSKK